MYGSAMKCCGMMEVCNLHTPFPIGTKQHDEEWLEVLAQAKATRSGVLVAHARDHKPEEYQFLASKGFKVVHSFNNPRTGSKLWVMVKDLTCLDSTG